MPKSKIIMMMKSLLLINFILCVLISTYGCIVLPIPYSSDDPFPDEKISFISLGTTSKNKIIEELSQPSTSRLGGTIFIYASGQRDWLWYGAYAIGAGYQGTAGHMVMPTYLTHLLIIEFDKNDIVTAAQEFVGDFGKLESGLYVENAGGYCTPIQNPYSKKGSNFFAPSEIIRNWQFSDTQFILRASDVMDKQAKQFSAPLNKSVIYYYKKFSDSLNSKLDNILSVNSGSTGFLMWVVDPGDHVIRTSDSVHPESLTIRCKPGMIYYVEHREGLLREEHKSLGEKEVASRKLVCDRFDPFDFAEYNIPSD
jgi:hypothetical protein